MGFQIHSLPARYFAHLFELNDKDLMKHQARRQRVDAKPGVPCRVSLEDAEIGETVILVNYTHQAADSPYRSTHAVFVREGAKRAMPSVGEVPEVLSSRLISLRGFDDAHMMIHADVVQGSDLATAITKAFEDQNIAYIHLHNAKPGCFAATVTRA